MDVLSDILNTLRFRSCVYFTTDFRPPWGLAVPAFRKVARFHLVMSGECWIRVGVQAEPHRLRAGDFMLIPHGAPHLMSDRPDREFADVDGVIRERGLDDHGTLVYGGPDDENATRLVCGHFEFDEIEHPLPAALPAQIIVRDAQAQMHDWLDMLLRLISSEAKARRPGSEFVLKRLTEVLFIQAVRTWAESSEGAREGLFAAIRDRHIGRSLNAIHKHAEDRLTVESLAREAGLSRTVFAERFRDLVGVSPMHYVTNWRMQRAQLLLTESDYSIDKVAVEVGYQSPVSFARVFRRVTGQSPGSVRRAAH